MPRAHAIFTGEPPGPDDFEARLIAACAAGAAHLTALRDGSGATIGKLVVLFAEPHVADDRAIRLSSLCADIASAVIERDRALQVAAHNEQRLSIALESSSVPFTVLSPLRDAGGRIVDFRWTYANPAAARSVGLERTAMIGRLIGEALPGRWDEPGLLARFVAAVEEGQACDFELPAWGRPGDCYQVIASPQQGDVAVWFADISARKRQHEELRAADRRKDEFLATLAHELRNPLAPIRQAAMLARSGADDERSRTRALDVIDRQARRMALLLDDLLDVSRISRGAIDLRHAEVLLSEVVDTALETAEPVMRAKRHRLQVDVPELPWMVAVDALRLSQALGNLLTNAAKYTDPGGQIRLMARVDATGVTLQVSDDGIGLAPEQLDRVFEMFSQEADAMDRSQGGLGIGLALARGLVELHGGSLRARSDGPGRGSSYVIALPRACIIGAATLPSDVAPTRRSAGAVAGPRMLVADDNVDAAETLAEVLRLDDHEVEVVYDGRGAVAAFERSRFDAVLLDVGMPFMTGPEAARAIRALPRGCDAVLIALTGWGQGEDQRAALAAGFDHHITKPAEVSELLALMAVGRAAKGSEIA